MDEPPEREDDIGITVATGEQVNRRVDSAAHHAAMVYRRLTATHRLEWAAAATEIRAFFVRHFGEAYEAEELRAITDESDDPPDPEPEEPEDGAGYWP